MCGRPRCWQWSITPINTRYSSLFFTWKKHILENQSNTNSGYLYYFYFLFLKPVLYFRQWLYFMKGTWIKRKIFVTLKIKESMHRHFTRFPSSWTQIRQSGAYFYTPYGFIQISKDGKRKCNYALKEDTQCQFAWDYEHENFRKLFLTSLEAKGRLS